MSFDIETIDIDENSQGVIFIKCDQDLIRNSMDSLQDILNSLRRKFPSTIILIIPKNILELEYVARENAKKHLQELIDKL